MVERAVGALRLQRRATLALLSQLEDEAWDAPCNPPWRIRDVVAHLIAIDAAAVTGRLLPLLRSAATQEDVERWNDEAVRNAGGAPPSALLADLEQAGERLATAASRLPGLAWRLRVRTVFGRHALAFLLTRRVLDEWVHMVDIARAAGRGAPDPVPCPDVLASAVLDPLPALVLPALTEPAGVVRLVVATGADPHGSQPRRTWGVDFARRQYGPRVTRAPDATIRLHVAALALLVEGREPGAEHGAIELEGDRALADRVLRGLAGA